MIKNLNTDIFDCDFINTKTGEKIGEFVNLESYSISNKMAKKYKSTFKMEVTEDMIQEAKDNLYIGAIMDFTDNTVEYREFKAEVLDMSNINKGEIIMREVK